MTITDDRLDQAPAPDHFEPKSHADELRLKGIRQFRHYWNVAEMEDAAWSRDPEWMLRSLREARTFVLAYYGRPGSEELLNEMDEHEAKLLRIGAPHSSEGLAS